MILAYLNIMHRLYGEIILYNEIQEVKKGNSISAERRKRIITTTAHP